MPRGAGGRPPPAAGAVGAADPLTVGGPLGSLATAGASASPAADPVPAHRGRRPGRAAAGRTAGRRSALAYLASGSCYLAVSVAVWWHVWTGHPTSTLTCGCGDPALFLWFLEWPAYALAHGHDPFYSTALFHPSGIDLLSNTSVLAIGIPLAPVTWLFGPVASLNVASTLAPVLSALATFWLLRRWVRWWPAAFVGGLLFGFSPFVVQSLAYAHLMTAALVVLPLMVGCLDELLVRQRRPPWKVGLVLGLLAVVEFFVSSEILAIVVVSAAVGLALLGAYRGWVDRADLARRIGVAAPGLATAATVVVVLLAYPVWVALAGPAHLAGRLWPNIPVVGGYVPASFVDPGLGSGKGLLLGIGGYLGRPLPSSGYLGWGLLAVLAAGLVVWRRDRRLWFFGVLAVVTALLSLAERPSQWVPWQLFDRIPVLDNVLEQRFVVVTDLAVAVMLAVVVDRLRHLHLAGRGWWAAGAPAARRVLPIATAALAVAGAAVALVPLVSTLAPALPLTTQPVGLPAWFADAAPRLPPGQVVLAYPPPFSGIQSAMAWQAVDRMHFALAGGGGPQGTPGRAGRERPGFVVLAALGFGFGAAPTGTPAELTAVRQAVAGWGVTVVVIPDQPGQPALLRGRDPRYAAGFMTAALGRPPVFQDGAWVWTGQLLARPALRIGPDALEECTDAPGERSRPPEGVASCVLSAAGAGEALRPAVG